MLTIRPAIAADLPAIHGLVADLAEFEKEAAAFTTSLATYQEQFAAGTFQAHVAETSPGDIVGMTLYYLTFSTWKGRMLYLEDFVVKEDYRGQGIGQQLFAAFIEEAKRQQCTMVKWQVLDWNTPAVNFYELQGATIEKNWWNAKIIF
ncbi:MAG: GNAT family N-acetyltransferase [Bacteroidota bacterium]